MQGQPNINNRSMLHQLYQLHAEWRGESSVGSIALFFGV